MNKDRVRKLRQAILDSPVDLGHLPTPLDHIVSLYEMQEGFSIKKPTGHPDDFQYLMDHFGLTFREAYALFANPCKYQITTAVVVKNLYRALVHNWPLLHYADHRQVDPSGNAYYFSDPLPDAPETRDR